MTDTATAAPAAVAATQKKAGKARATASKNPRVKAAHPPTADMVNSAIRSLKERGGSSLQAIKKYIAANYQVDAEKVAPFIKKYIRAAVTSGALVQTKGKGASGSFRLANKESAEKRAPAKPKAARKTPAAPAKERKPKAAVARKPAAKKAVAAKRKPAAAAAAKKPRSPSKAKKVAKAPPAAARKPKPKKAVAKPRSAPKKAAKK